MINNKCLTILLGIYAILFTILAFNPVDRITWFVENLTVWIIIAVILILYARNVRFSNTAYVLMFVLVYLHTIGGHWTFAQVPFGYVTEFFGFERNHFDRVAHFTVGFYAYPIAEWIVSKRIVSSKFIVFTYPIFVIATIAMSYELVEWIYASDAPPGLGDAYLGSQGDEWDAQKDMLADTLGAIVATIFYMVRRTVMRASDRKATDERAS
jgi:putative membrane protein